MGIVGLDDIQNEESWSISALFLDSHPVNTVVGVIWLDIKYDFAKVHRVCLDLNVSHQLTSKRLLSRCLDLISKPLGAIAHCTCDGLNTLFTMQAFLSLSFLTSFLQLIDAVQLGSTDWPLEAFLGHDLLT